MKSVVVPAVLSAAVAAVVSLLVTQSTGRPDTQPAAADASRYLTQADVSQMLASYKRNPPLTTLTLYMDGEQCKAEVDADPVGNFPEKRVFWYVLNDSDYPCPLNDPYPRIKLVFKPHPSTQYPFSTREVTSKRQNDLVYVHERIKKVGKDANKEVGYGEYSYAVHLLNGTKTDPNTPVLDPILEVEDSNVRSTGAAAAQAPAPAPPKKQ